MHFHLPTAILLSLTLSGALAARSAPDLAPQRPGANLLMHFDGISEGTYADPLTAPSITVLQRFPQEQCCGRDCLECIELMLRDGNSATPENYTIEVRTGGGPPPLGVTDAPNMTALGVLASFPMTSPPSGIPGVQDFKVNKTFPCVHLPPGDFYIAVVLPRNAAWPADGLSCHFSNNEKHRVPHTPRYALFPDVGLGWVSPLLGPAALQPPGNVSWHIGAGLDDDVLQPFAQNPIRFAGLAGLNPNFGYAGIWPDAAPLNLDQFGWRLRASVGVGSACILIVGVTCFPHPGLPIPFAGPGLCASPDITIASTTTLPDGLQCCNNVSVATFGPFGCPTCPPLVLCAQAATLDIVTGIIRLSTGCVMDL